MSGRRRVAHVLGCLALLVCLAVATASSAAAVQRLPSIPGIPDCKDAPAAQMPGNGLTGFLDPPPATPPPAGNPFAKKPATSIYEQYGYAGLTWHTYDLGCGGDIRDMSAATDTMFGNAFLSMASWGIAATNGLHNRISRPQEYMAPLDDVVATVTQRVHDAIWSPWGGAALLGVVVLLLFYSSAGRLPDVTRAATWAILVLTVMSGLAQYPSRVSSFFDDTVTGTIATINRSTAGLSALPPGADPTRSQGALLVDGVLYDAWVRGEFGSSDSPAAKKWAPTLFRASAFTLAEAREAESSPQKAQQLADAKAQQWKDAAQEIQDQDPAAYAALQGKTGDRAGAGLMAMFGGLFTGLFRIIADLFTFAGLVMLRFLVMFFPAVAVIGVMAPMASVVRRVANMAGASVVNVIAFSAGSAVHTTAISATLTRAQTGGMNLLALLLCAVLTLTAFIVLFPLLSLTNVVGLRAGAGGGSGVLRRAGRLAVRYGVARKAVHDGTHDEDEHVGPEGGPAPTDTTGEPSSASRRYRLVDLKPESFGRPEPARPLVADGTSIAGPSRPRAALAAQNVVTAERLRVDTAAVGELRSRGSGNELPRPALPDRGSEVPQPRRARIDGEVLEGVVVDHPGVSAVPPEGRRVHDSQIVIHSDGVGPRLYDPDTKASVRVDADGNLVDDEAAET